MGLFIKRKKSKTWNMKEFIKLILSIEDYKELGLIEGFGIIAIQIDISFSAKSIKFESKQPQRIYIDMKNYDAIAAEFHLIEEEVNAPNQFSNYAVLRKSRKFREIANAIQIGEAEYKRLGMPKDFTSKIQAVKIKKDGRTEDFKPSLIYSDNLKLIFKERKKYFGV